VPSTQTDPAGFPVWVNGRAVVVPEGAAQIGDGPRVIARFSGPVLSRWVSTLRRAGATVAFWCPPYGACLTLDRPDRAPAVASLPFVAGFVPFVEDHCDRGLEPPPTGPGQRWLDVICFSSTERPAVVEALQRLGAEILDQTHSKIRIAWTGDVRPIREVVGVKLVERPKMPRPARTGLASDIDDAAPDGSFDSTLDGAGEIVGFADTGLDTGVASTVAADVNGRVKRIVSWPINPSWTPYVTNPGADDGAADRNSGHGTYVTGVAVGDGAASGGTHRGVADKAKVVFQAIEQFVNIAPGHADLGSSGFQLAGRPTDLRDLFVKGYTLGARVQINAWGTEAHARYDNDCYEADLFLSEHRSAVVLFAAGNEGSDVDGNRRIDPGSLESPGVAKNVITVGATEGSALIGFTGTWTNLQTEGRVFANPIDRADPVAGQPDRMALLSSAGPTHDGRIKPDVCAPGTDIVGPRSSLAAGTGWGLVAPTAHYMVDGGTSVAVAVAGGVVTLLRQAWRRHLGRAPAGATLKALTVLGGASVLSRDGTRPEDRSIAGFGRVDVGASMPTTTTGDTVLVLSDSTTAGGARTGSSRVFDVTLPAAGRLRAVLCWYDAPGENLVNNLNLSITGAGLPAPTWGNHPAGAAGVPDLLNTVEVIDIDPLPAGTYQLTVAGANVPSGRQPYSLVVRGRAISSSH
jgi:hypothetical protein